MALHWPEDIAFSEYLEFDGSGSEELEFDDADRGAPGFFFDLPVDDLLGYWPDSSSAILVSSSTTFFLRLTISVSNFSILALSRLQEIKRQAKNIREYVLFIMRY